MSIFYYVYYEINTKKHKLPLNIIKKLSYNYKSVCTNFDNIRCKSVYFTSNFAYKYNFIKILNKVGANNESKEY
ncbi:hypothetical protein NL50_07320 [Clostridium acetobutylicum]|nr:hypothetical protein NL50_07320 [Clostridium acetobutylicum]